MRKFLSARGNGWALIVPKDVIKLLGMVPETAKLKFEFKNKTLYIQEVLEDSLDVNKYLIRKFSRKNTSWTLYMPNSIIELLEINPETDKVDIDINGQILIIKKAAV